MSADTPSDRRLHRRRPSPSRSARRSCRSCCRRPRQVRRSGDCRHRHSGGVIDALDGPRIELLTREQMRALCAARRRLAQGRLRPRASSSPARGEDGRRPPGRAGRAAIRGGPGHGGTPRSCQPSSPRMGSEYMTEPLDETVDGTVALRALDRVLTPRRRRARGGPGLGRGAGVTTFVRGLLERARCRSCSTPTRSTRSPTTPSALVGREGRDVIITPHPGEMARLVGCTVEDVQANRSASASTSRCRTGSTSC
jgi:ADP-dependent NAD(P)H-hydrate dehydratase / NAD(P)H-hydrate epimerase